MRPLDLTLIGGRRGAHTEMWRTFSWSFGDSHADRICKLLSLYAWLFGLTGKCRNIGSLR